MTIIYIDELLLLNFLINFFLLLGTAHLTGTPYKRWRLALGALLGALYALATVLPGMHWAAAALMKLVVGVLMVLLSFGYSHRPVRTMLLFFAASFAFGGTVLALGLLRSGVPLSAGLVYAPAGLRLLVGAGAICYGLALLIFGRLARHGGIARDLLLIRLTLDGRRVELTALKDSGNTLSDPLSGEGILVAEREALLPLLPPELRRLFSPESLREPGELLGLLGELGYGRRFRLIPYRAVGTKEGLLLALRTDSAAVGKEHRKGLLTAFSPSPLSDGGGYCALIGG